MNLSRGGICYNFESTPFKHTINYGGVHSITYSFSSQLYKTKFIEGYEEHRNKINSSLTKRFGIDISFDVLSDVKFYSSVEKRGFLINTHESIECLSTIKLSGETLTTKS